MVLLADESSIPANEHGDKVQRLMSRHSAASICMSEVMLPILIAGSYARTGWHG